MNMRSWMVATAIGLSCLTMAGCVSESGTYESGYYASSGPTYYRDSPRYDRYDRVNRRDYDRPDRRRDDRRDRYEVARDANGDRAGRSDRNDRRDRNRRCVDRSDCVVGDRLDRPSEYNNDGNTITIR